MSRSGFGTPISRSASLNWIAAVSQTSRNHVDVTQRLREVARRDRTCTWGGCTIPAAWCHVHHNVWWSRGGRTRLEDGALLCQHHHTIVHERDLTATITATGVTWPT